MNPTLKKLIEQAVSVKTNIVFNKPNKALIEINKLLATIHTLGGKLKWDQIVT